MPQEVLSCIKKLKFVFETDMLKPLGVSVPGSTQSTMVGTQKLVAAWKKPNPLADLAAGVTPKALRKLRVKELREVITTLNTLEAAPVKKTGTKATLIQRILAAQYTETAITKFLAGKDTEALVTFKELRTKLFTSLRGALRDAGAQILRSLKLPYSVPALSGDPLPPGAHLIGACPDPDDECLLCRTFGSLTHAGVFRCYTPPLVDDPQQTVTLPREVNHVLIRMHQRHTTRPAGQTHAFSQQYFAGTFTTYLEFPDQLPDPVVLGFLIHCVETCREAGGAKAWGAGKLFLRSYTLQRVQRSLQRTWNAEREVYEISETFHITPLKDELDQALAEYAAWLADVQTRAQLPEQAGEEVEV